MAEEEGYVRVFAAPTEVGLEAAGVRVRGVERGDLREEGVLPLVVRAGGLPPLEEVRLPCLQQQRGQRTLRCVCVCCICACLVGGVALSIPPLGVRALQDVSSVDVRTSSAERMLSLAASPAGVDGAAGFSSCCSSLGASFSLSLVMGVVTSSASDSSAAAVLGVMVRPCHWAHGEGKSGIDHANHPIDQWPLLNPGRASLVERCASLRPIISNSSRPMNRPVPETHRRAWHQRPAATRARSRCSPWPCCGCCACGSSCWPWLGRQLGGGVPLLF